MTTSSPRPTRHARGHRALAVVAVCGALTVSACSAPGSDSSSQPEAKSPSSISTDPAKAGKVTLSVWDQEVRGGQNAEITALNKQFQAKYPNVTIKRTSKSFSDLKTTLKLALSGNNPPDVVEANQGYPDMVTFVKAGMLLPLDSYSKAYGWSKRYPATLLALNKVSADASHFGEGKLYGLSQMGEYVGVYYNKTKLKQLGLTPPATWSELTADLPKIKAKGELPIQFGNLDKWPAIHTFGVIQAATAGKQDVRDLVFGTGNATWTSAPTVQAATTLQTWAKKGYFPSGVNGIGYDDANKQFAQGKGVFDITGTWLAADIKGPMGSSLGLMPTPAGSKGLATTGGESLAFSVTSKSKEPDVAAAYIDFITDARAADVMLKTGNLPAVPGQAASGLSSASVEGQLVGGWQKISAADGLVPYLDYSTPTFYDTLTAALQNLIGGKSTPQQFTKALQTDYSKFHKS
jgi:raffinose/stachyose/melibiose transport system substrate-binding protein